MFRIGQASSIRRQAAVPIKRALSSTSKPSAGPLEADAGAAATHVHHAMTTFLAVATPAIFMVPDSWTEGFLDKTFGLLVAVNVSAHSWIGLNYVVTDYVPKVSKSLLGPARVFTAGMGLVTLFGLGKVAISSKGGIKGCVKGLWNPPPKESKKSA